MKKVLFLVVLLAAVLVPLTVSAEYLTYYDILQDVEILTRGNFDSLWEKTADEAKEAVSSLYGYTCGDMEDNIITCSQTHWTGRYWINLHFTDNKLDCADFKLTSDGLKDLNYKRNGTTQVYQADLFLQRMQYANFFDYMNKHREEGFTLFYSVLPDEDTCIHTPALQADDHSFLQLGYNVISSTNPEFSLEFVITSDEYAKTYGTIDFPEGMMP